jgi:hypothetical protein
MIIIFEMSYENGVFRDALNLPDDHGLSDDELAAMKQARFDNWFVFVNTPPAPDTPLAPEEG